jgi:hypothetical protein
LSTTNSYIYYTPKTLTVKSVSSYKLKRLIFTNKGQFWKVWREPAETQKKTPIQLIYIMTTCMSLARFNVTEMMQMLIGWHNKHDYRIDYGGLQAIIKSVNAFTLETRRERKRNEMRRYRLRKKAAPGVSK